MFTTESERKITIYTNGNGFTDYLKPITRYLVSHELMHIFYWLTGGSSNAHGPYAIGNWLYLERGSKLNITDLAQMNPVIYKAFYPPEYGLLGGLNNWGCEWIHESPCLIDDRNDNNPDNDINITQIQSQGEIMAEMLNMWIWDNSPPRLRPNLLPEYNPVNPSDNSYGYRDGLGITDNNGVNQPDVVVGYINLQMAYWVTLANNSACHNHANPSVCDAINGFMGVEDFINE